MTERWVKPGDLGVTRLLFVFAVMSVVFVAVLAFAPARSHFTEWREAQVRYSGLASAQGADPIGVNIRQVFKPALGVVDRCASCHLGMGGAAPLAGDKLFGAHPAVHHDPAEVGCTSCHGGQGRATRKDAAHGNVRFWDLPMLEPGTYEAGCGSCHTHLHVPSLEAWSRGEALFRRYDCLACHLVDGTGRGVVDLSGAGLKGVPRDWHDRHLAWKKERTEKEWAASYSPIPPEDVALISEYLRGLSGAPRLVRAKVLAHRLGCRGCHRINGVGGDEGPDLTREGIKAISDLDFSGVEGPKTLRNWLLEHFLEPAAVVRDSRMPSFGLSREDADLLTLYMLSLRPLDSAQAAWPRDRVRGARLGEREFATDGATLYAAFCSGCHGPRGEGRRFANRDTVFPAIGNPDFLAIASDDFLRATVTRGRPGRPMPAWGGKDSGLTPEEMDAVVRFLRSLAPGTPVEIEALPPGDPSRGQALYARHCAACHGQKAEGGEAPALGNPEFLAAASDAYIQQTILRGRGGTQMRHFGRPMLGFPTLDPSEVADITAWLRTLAPQGSNPARSQ